MNNLTIKNVVLLWNSSMGGFSDIDARQYLEKTDFLIKDKRETEVQKRYKMNRNVYGLDVSNRDYEYCNVVDVQGQGLGVLT